MVNLQLGDNIELNEVMETEELTIVVLLPNKIYQWRILTSLDERNLF